LAPLRLPRLRRKKVDSEAFWDDCLLHIGALHNPIREFPADTQDWLPAVVYRSEPPRTHMIGALLNAVAPRSVIFCAWNDAMAATDFTARHSRTLETMADAS